LSYNLCPLPGAVPSCVCCCWQLTFLPYSPIYSFLKTQLKNATSSMVSPQ
jgi:hypothetical protein